MNFSKSLTICTLIYAALAVVVCWPFLNSPTQLIMNGDNLLTSWTLGHNLRSLTTNPRDFYNLNYFYPHQNGLTFSDGLFTQTIVALPFYLIFRSLPITYNLLICLSFIAAALAMYALAHHYTRRPLISFIAGLIFGFSTYRLISLDHFQNQLVFWMPLAILFLDKWTKDYRWRDAILCALMFAGQALSSWYNGYFLALFIVFFLAVHARTLWEHRKFSLKQGLVAVALSVAIILPLAWPYIALNREAGATFPIKEPIYYSADFGGYLLPSPFSLLGKLVDKISLTKTRWPENINFIGYSVLIVFALYLWQIHRRKTTHQPLSRIARIYLWGIPLFALLSFGPRLHLFDQRLRIPLPYDLIWRFFPLTHFMRVPGRMAIIVIFCTALGVAFVLAQLFKPIPSPSLVREGNSLSPDKGRVGEGFKTMALFAIAIAFFAESYRINVKNNVLPVPACTPLYQAIADDDSVKAIVEYPIDPTPTKTVVYLYSSACHNKPLFNGYNGYTPPEYASSAETARALSEASIAYLQKLGITHLTFHSQNTDERDAMLIQLQKLPKISSIQTFDLDILAAIDQTKFTNSVVYATDFSSLQLNQFPDEPTRDNLTYRESLDNKDIGGIISTSLEPAGAWRLAFTPDKIQNTLSLSLRGMSSKDKDNEVIELTVTDAVGHTHTTEIIHPSGLTKWDNINIPVSADDPQPLTLKLTFHPQGTTTDRLSLTNLALFLH